MPPRARISQCALCLDPPWAWRSHQPTPSLASLNLNYALLSMVLNSKRTLSRYYPPDFFLNRWVWSDLFSEALLLFPLEDPLSDVKRAEAQLVRDQDRAARHYPLAGKTSHFDLLPRFSTYLASLSVREATVNAYFMKGIERYVTTPASALSRTSNANPFSPNYFLCLRHDFSRRHL